MANECVVIDTPALRCDQVEHCWIVVYDHKDGTVITSGMVQAVRPTGDKNRLLDRMVMVVSNFVTGELQEVTLADAGLTKHAGGKMSETVRTYKMPADANPFERNYCVKTPAPMPDSFMMYTRRLTGMV